jgi:hypothetical protein
VWQFENKNYCEPQIVFAGNCHSFFVGKFNNLKVMPSVETCISIGLKNPMIEIEKACRNLEYP